MSTLPTLAQLTARAIECDAHYAMVSQVHEYPHWSALATLGEFTPRGNLAATIEAYASALRLRRDSDVLICGHTHQHTGGPAAFDDVRNEFATLEQRAATLIELAGGAPSQELKDADPSRYAWLHAHTAGLIPDLRTGSPTLPAHKYMPLIYSRRSTWRPRVRRGPERYVALIVHAGVLARMSAK